MLHRLNWSLVSAIVVALVGGAMGAVLVGMANVALTILGAAGGIGLGAYTGAILGGLVFGDEEEDALAESQALDDGGRDIRKAA